MQPVAAYGALLISLIWIMSRALRVQIAARTAVERELRLARQEWERADTLLHTIIESAPCLIYAKDRQGRMLVANPPALTLIGKTWTEVEGRTDLEFLADRVQAEAVTRNDRQLMEADRVEEFEESVGAAGEQARIWLSIKAPLHDRDGVVSGLVGISIEVTDKKRIQAELARNSERMSIASQAAGHGYWDFNIESNTLRWDDEMFHLYGHARAEGEQPYTLWAQSLHPDDRACSERELRAAIDGISPFDTDFRIVHPDGQTRHIKTLARVIRNSAGRAIHMFGVNFDITERKEAEMHADRALQRLHEAQRIGQIGDWEYDLRTDGVTWSPHVFEIFGRDPGLGPPRNYEEHAAMHDAASGSVLEANVARAIESGEPQAYELWVMRPDGRRVRVHATAVPRKDRTGEVVALYGTVQDISERQRAEVLARESEQRYRFLLEMMPQIIWTATPDGNLDYFNQRWSDYTGMTFEQSKDSGWKQVLHPEDVQKCNDLWTAAYTTGGRYQLEYRFKRAADGAYRWHLVRASPLRNTDGAIIQWIGTCTDIDDQKRATENLLLAHATLEHRVLERTAELDVAKVCAESASKAKSEFLANMSHEIRTPLNAVIGLGYLLEQTSLTEDQHQFVAKIQFAGRSLLSVVNNVMDLSKIEAREMALEDEAFDMFQLVDEIQQMLKPQAAVKGVELAMTVSPVLPRRVMGDVTRLRQILVNLMSNSIKFTAKGQVHLDVGCVEAAAAPVRLRCVVRDTGIGIEPAALERLFTPFTQADASTTRRFGGTGLGLSISRCFVELMGGEIGVTSTVGEGSTFWFEIPLHLTPRSDAATMGLDDSGSVRVLIADSAGESPAGLATMVRALGWTPHLVESIAPMVAALNNDQPGMRPDVLVLDVHLLDPDPSQIMARLERDCAPAELPPVVLILDNAQSYLNQLPFMRNEDALLVRPVTSSALFNAINSVVWKRHEARERMLQNTNFDELRALWLAGVHVLVVDDSEINLEVARRILEKQGAIVASCGDGDAAVAHVRAHHLEVDIVLMDVQMPILDGNEATRRIRGELQLLTLPIVALTAGALLGERQRSLEAGMNDFVSKPFDPLLLIRKVRHLVEFARGQPIPMILADSHPDHHDAGTPLMSSIDGAVMQQMFGDDIALFTSLVTRLLREYTDLAVAVPGWPADTQTNRKELQRRVHKLKGSAGMIGASRIATLAGAAEAALQKDRPFEGIMKKLAAALMTLRDEAQPLLQRQSSQAAPRVPAEDKSPSASRTEIDALCALLESQNIAAMAQFSALSAGLTHRLGTPRFELLRESVDNLDFALAAAMLRDATP